MADKTINIGQPVLVAPAKFRTRHRLLPNGAFTAFTDRTSNSFTITGLSEGEYEIEIMYVNEQGVECSVVTQTFNVAPDFTCPSFNAQLVYEGGIYKIRITYGTITNNPPCGWNIFYQHGSGATGNIPYDATLPATGVINIPVPSNAGSYVRVEANKCDGAPEFCYNNDVPGLPPPPCSPITGVTYNIREVRNAQTGRCEYFVDISFTQSNPVSTQVTLVYLQSNTSVFIADQFNGLINVGPGPVVNLTRKLNPGFQAGQECTRYTFNVIDRCNNGVQQQIDYCRTQCFHATP